MKWLVFLCTTLICLCFSTSLKVGVYHNPPLIEFSEGRASGLYAEILEQLASTNNWDIEYVFDEFSTLLDKLRNGQIDLMTAIAYTPQRSEMFDFNNQAVILNWGVICVKGTLSSLLDLQDKIIAIVNNDVYAEYLKKQIDDFKMKVRYFYVQDYEKALEAVKKGLADACIVSRIFAQNNVQRYSLNISGIVFSPIELRFALPKNTQKNQIVIQAIDDFLYKIKSNQESYNQLLSRYLGTYMEKRVIPKWVETALVLAIVVAGLFVLWTNSLKRVVATRTDELNKALRELIHKNEELIAANEEIRAQSEELETLNEELEKTLKDLENAIQRFTQSLNLFGQLATFSKDEEFCWEFLKMVRSVAPNCSAALSYMNLCYLQTKDGVQVVSSIDSYNLPEGRFEGLPLQLPYTFDQHQKVYEAISIRSNDLYLILLNHSEKKISSEIEMAKSLLNIVRVFLRIKSYEENEKQFYRRINDVLITILNYHEPYTAVHSTRSSDYAVKIAQNLFLNDEAIARVYWASLIHDIGKIAIPREILCKSSKLSPEEFEAIKIHPVVAADLLEKAGLRDIAKIVRHHHERFDGNGYPDGLKAEQIPIESRIIAVVDAYDAMISDRPYRKAMSSEKAIEELKANAGSQFDPLIVEIFIELLKKE
ncbi:HD domain-containing phosphohydrolase [Thermotoga profunda]|uniref:HD domain-containing phosphohydrolase n=1 Tax=Thermotoga profunda TaxID=1508420 RepID=UPI000870991D|nr:HD domain-containing phosphohydrolase [Thermotoga profunda]